MQLTPTLLLSAFAAHTVHAAAIMCLAPRDCAQVHIIVARASTEAPGAGVIGSLAKLIQSSRPGTTVDTVDYPATLSDYANSSAKGTKALTAQLTAYVQECPESKVVLLGYSQGAHVVGDVLCGGGGGSALGATTPPISASIGSHVAAVIQMGDPRHVAGLSYDVGSSTHNGLFPRNTKTQSCAAYASKIQSYCDRGDPFCDSGNDTQVHLVYTSVYNSAAKSFVLTKV